MSALAAVIGHGEPASTGDATGLLVTETTVPAPLLYAIPSTTSKEPMLISLKWPLTGAWED